jgi:3-oxoacyl-[acyl-carrier protein] reductase
MKLSLSGRLFESPKGYTLALEEFLTFSRKTGYDGVEIRYPQLPMETPKSKLADVKKMLGDQGLTWVFGTVEGIADDKVFERSLRTMDNNLSCGCLFTRFTITKPEHIPIAQRFADEGAIVAIGDVNEVAGREAAEVLGGQATFTTVDVSDRTSVQAWVDGVVARHGRIDVLINNAGITRDAQLVKVKDGDLVAQMAETDFDLVIGINLKGVFTCTQAVAPVMITQGGGSIVSASSVVAFDGNFGQTNYVATKAGVIGMTKVWARELGRYGIRINAVAPGFTATEMVASMPEKVQETMRTHTPLGRLGTPADIANAYLFLASDEAAFITGGVLRVGGGLVVGT